MSRKICRSFRSCAAAAELINIATANATEHARFNMALRLLATTPSGRGDSAYCDSRANHSIEQVVMSQSLVMRVAEVSLAGDRNEVTSSKFKVQSE
jgi:hypothetical protein